MRIAIDRGAPEPAYRQIEGRGAAGTFVLGDDRRPPAETVAAARDRPQGEARRRDGAPDGGSRTGVIDFSGGGGDDSLFPFSAFLRGLGRRAASGRDSALGTADPRGEPAFRAAVSGVLASHGLAALPDDILATGGSQQAITLVAAALCSPGGAVLVEEPSYGAAIALFRELGLRPVPLPCDRDGPTESGIAAAMEKERSPLVYVMPTFRNPDGACMAEGRRRFLARAPALAAGFLVAPGPLGDRMARLKSLAGMACLKIVQGALADFIDAGSYRRHLRKACRRYAARRDALAAEVPDFYAESRAGAAGFVRLNFASMGEADIREGARRLGAAAAEALSAQPRT